MQPSTLSPLLHNWLTILFCHIWPDMKSDQIYNRHQLTWSKTIICYLVFIRYSLTFIRFIRSLNSIRFVYANIDWKSTIRYFIGVFNIIIRVFQRNTFKLLYRLILTGKIENTFHSILLSCNINIIVCFFYFIRVSKNRFFIIWQLFSVFSVQLEFPEDKNT